LTRHLLVIGAQRCGTTHLYELLDAHPDIAMARPRRPEPKVFLSDELAARGPEWYRATYFAHAGAESLLGEKSTSYIEDREAPARAARMLGGAEIVLQLRDPVARAISNWRFSTANGVEDRPLVQALEENLKGPRSWDPTRTSVSPYAYLERGRYVDYLEPWFASFPTSVHVIFLEDESGQRVPVAGLYQSLGVDSGFRPPSEDIRVNESTGTTPEIGQELVDQLREYYRDSDERLARRIGHAVPWLG
jgi:hypothetical protein